MTQNNKQQTREFDNTEPVLNFTDKMVFAVREGNEYQAVEAAHQQIEAGLPSNIDNPLLNWQFFLIRTLTLMTDVMIHNGRMKRYLEQFAVERVKLIGKAESVKECQGLLVDFVKDGCRLNADIRHPYSIQVQRIMEEVAMDLTQPLTLQFFAAKLNVNSSYLSNLFRQQAGVTITDYVTDKRLSHAATLLSYTQKPIKSIARQVGIPDVQYFSRLFKRKMNMTPTQYREKASSLNSDSET